jgi:hypothetical protein
MRLSVLHESEDVRPLSFMVGHVLHQPMRWMYDQSGRLLLMNRQTLPDFHSGADAVWSDLEEKIPPKDNWYYYGIGYFDAVEGIGGRSVSAAHGPLDSTWFYEPIDEPGSYTTSLKKIERAWRQFTLGVAEAERRGQDWVRMADALMNMRDTSDVPDWLIDWAKNAPCREAAFQATILSR